MVVAFRLSFFSVVFFSLVFLAFPELVVCLFLEDFIDLYKPAVTRFIFHSELPYCYTVFY